MNTADILILAVLALSMLFGLLRGFVSTVLSLLCWIAAFWVAWAFGASVAPFYGGVLGVASARLAAGYVSCFVGVLIAGAVLGWLLRKLMDHGGLRGADRFFGLLFGLGRGVLLVAFAVLVLGFAGMGSANWWRQSMLLPAFSNVSGWFAGRLPPAVNRGIEHARASLPALPEAPISTVRRAARSLAAPAAAGSTAATTRAAGRVLPHGPNRGDVGQ